jgi:glycosyltransferase involved in cell wall biosynthesis
MKIVTYTSRDILAENTSNGMAELWRKMGHEVFIYSIADKSEDLFRMKTRHFQIYENVLNYAEEMKADILLFDHLLNCPEYLLSDLEMRPNYKPKIIFNFAFRESYRSLSRTNTLIKLIKMSQIKKVFVESMFGPDTIFPNTWIYLKDLIGLNLDNKLKLIYDRETNIEVFKNKIDKSVALEKFNRIPRNKFIILFFGRLIYSKGVDILADAIDKLSDNYFFLIQSDPSNIDFDFNPIERFNKKNVRYYGSYINNEYLPYLYNSCDAIILPHRKSYTYGSTGIPYQAALLDKTCIFPDIYPLNAICDKYKLGAIYKCENVDSMVEVIKYTKEHYIEIKEKALFKEYLKCTTSIKEMAKLVIS